MCLCFSSVNPGQSLHSMVPSLWRTGSPFVQSSWTVIKLCRLFRFLTNDAWSVSTTLLVSSFKLILASLNLGSICSSVLEHSLMMR